MSKITSIRSLPSAEVKCQDLRGLYEGLAAVESRHTGIPGYDQSVYSSSTVGLVGAGGLNGENAEGMARKGIGKMWACDGDTVEAPNLNRQFFTSRDIGKSKPECLAHNLKDSGFMGTRIVPYSCFFQEAVEKGIEFTCDAILCGVDNDQTRIFVSRYGLTHRIPVVFSAVSEDGNNGYVFVQEPDGPCFGCAFPHAISNLRMPCPGTPAIKDILKAVSALTLYALDSLLMERKRNWNYRMMYLAGFVPESVRWIEKNPTCSLCSNQVPMEVSQNGLD